MLTNWKNFGWILQCFLKRRETYRPKSVDNYICVYCRLSYRFGNAFGALLVISGLRVFYGCLSREFVQRCSDAVVS